MTPGERFWFIDLGNKEARIRCSFQRLRKKITRFVVQLEINVQGLWLPVARYDNAHGFCHRDNLHPDGSQEKTQIHIGDNNETFTYAVEDFKVNWKVYRSRYLREIKDGP